MGRDATFGVLHVRAGGERDRDQPVRRLRRAADDDRTIRMKEWSLEHRLLPAPFWTLAAIAGAAAPGVPAAPVASRVATGVPARDNVHFAHQRPRGA